MAKKDPFELTDEEVAALENSPALHRELAEKITERFVQIIKGLLGRYVGVLGYSAGIPRRFGIQMSAVTSDTTILATIVSFLCNNDKDFLAVTWLCDEVSIWSFD